MTEYFTDVTKSIIADGNSKEVFYKLYNLLLRVEKRRGYVLKIEVLNLTLAYLIRCVKESENLDEYTVYTVLWLAKNYQKVLKEKYEYQKYRRFYKDLNSLIKTIENINIEKKLKI